MVDSVSSTQLARLRRGLDLQRQLLIGHESVRRQRQACERRRVVLCEASHCSMAARSYVWPSGGDDGLRHHVLRDGALSATPSHVVIYRRFVLAFAWIWHGGTGAACACGHDWSWCVATEHRRSRSQHSGCTVGGSRQRLACNSACSELRYGFRHDSLHTWLDVIPKGCKAA